MLVVYDDNGTIYFAGTGRPEPEGIPYLNVEVPEGKYFAGIDTSITPHRAIFKDVKKTELELLKEEVAAQIATQQWQLDELQSQNAANAENAAAIENALCEQDTAIDERMTAIEDAICELDATINS